MDGGVQMAIRLTAVQAAALGDNFIITKVSNPSPTPDDDVLTRRVDVGGITPHRRDLFLAAVEAHNVRQRTVLWDQFAELALNDFTMHALEIEWGRWVFWRDDETSPWQVRRRPIDDDVMHLIARQLGDRPIRANSPLALPWADIDLNAGDDDLCVARFVPDHVDVHENTEAGVIAACTAAGVHCELFDMMGKRMGATPGVDAVADLGAKVYRAVYAFGHVYPLLRNRKRPALPRGDDIPLHGYQTHEELAATLEEARAAVFRRDGVYYVGDPGNDAYGAWKLEMEDEAVFEPWMEELQDKVAVHAWDHDAVTYLSRGTGALLYTHEDLATIELENLVTVDMSRCYYHALAWLVHADHQMLAEPAGPLSRWHVIPGELRDKWPIQKHAFYMVRFADPARAERMGLRSNVLYYVTANILRDAGIEFTLEHILPLLPAQGQSAMSAVVRGWSDEPVKQKKYALLNGIFGKTRVTHDTLVQVTPNDTAEAEYYTMRYGMEAISEGSNLMHSTDSYLCDRTRYHVHACTIHMANALVLAKQLAIKREFPNARLVKVRTDSLTYDVRSMLSPWHISRDAVVETMLAASTEDRRLGPRCVPWHEEDPCVDRIVAAPIRYLNPTELVNAEADLAPDYSANVCFNGAPGTGKTYQMLALRPDLVLTYTNAGVRRLLGDGARAAKTLHSAFGMYQTGTSAATEAKTLRSMTTMYGMTIGVDEAQTLPPNFWSLLSSLWHASRRDGRPVKYIFTADPNQLPPVLYRHLMTHDMPPMVGQCTLLTRDYRNSVELQRLRDAILRDGIIADMATSGLRVVNFDPEYMRLAQREHLCLSHATRAYVNRQMMEQEDKEFGDNGMPYLVKRTMKTKRLYKGHVLEKREGLFYAPGDDTPIKMSAKQMDQYLEPGYARTVASTIGATLINAYGLWDIKHVHASRSWLYTAITRAKTLDQITVYECPATEPRYKRFCRREADEEALAAQLKPVPPSTREIHEAIAAVLEDDAADEIAWLEQQAARGVPLVH